MLFEKDHVMKSYSNQTGKFPIPSSRGNHHIIVLYHYDTNTIHAVAIPNRQAASIRDAWETIRKSVLNMLLISGPILPMVKKCNLQTPARPSSSTKQALSVFNPSLVLFSIILEPLIQLSSEL